MIFFCLILIKTVFVLSSLTPLPNVKIDLFRCAPYRDNDVGLLRCVGAYFADFDDLYYPSLMTLEDRSAANLTQLPISNSNLSVDFFFTRVTSQSTIPGPFALGLGMGSSIVQTFTDFILTPDSLILSPTIDWATRHCFSSEFTIVDLVSNTSQWAVYATPHIGRLSNFSETTIPCCLNVDSIRDRYLIDTNSPFTVISNDEYELFIHFIERSGATITVRESRGTMQAVVENCEAIMDRLPLISFAMFDNRNRPLVQFSMDPVDYIPNPESCVLTIRGTSLPRNVPYLEPRFGDNFLRELHVLFSASQQLVGFCDPV